MAIAGTHTVPQSRRGYRSPRREEQARRTRALVIEVASRMFVQHGYAASTMRAIAAQAGVSVPTVELVFGTKPQLLKAVIDVAIAGDDEPVRFLQREWAAEASTAHTVAEFLAMVGQVLRPAQTRSAGLVVVAYEAAPTDPQIAALVRQLESHRAATVGWIVDAILERAALRPGVSRELAIDTLWLLMDPVLFCRLTQQRSWSAQDYEHWFTDSIPRLLLPPTDVSTTTKAGTRTTHPHDPPRSETGLTP